MGFKQRKSKIEKKNRKKRLKTKIDPFDASGAKTSELGYYDQGPTGELEKECPEGS